MVHLSHSGNTFWCYDKCYTYLMHHIYSDNVSRIEVSERTSWYTTTTWKTNDIYSHRWIRLKAITRKKHSGYWKIHECNENTELVHYSQSGNTFWYYNRCHTYLKPLSHSGNTLWYYNKCYTYLEHLSHCGNTLWCYNKCYTYLEHLSISGNTLWCYNKC